MAESPTPKLQSRFVWKWNGMSILKEREEKGQARSADGTDMREMRTGDNLGERQLWQR